MNEFLLLCFAHMVAVASPGPDFVVVLKNTLSSGKKSGIYTAIGVGCGIGVHIVYTLLGIAVIFSQSDILLTGIKLIGAIYLVWLAWQMFQSRSKSSGKFRQKANIQINNFQAFQQGFLTNVFNPKATLFFLILFTNIVSIETPLFNQALYGVWLMLYTIAWFMFVAWTFSRQTILSWYESKSHFIDWFMGVILVLLALKLFF